MSSNRVVFSFHEYATATADEVHESAGLVAGNFAAFYEAYRD